MAQEQQLGAQRSLQDFYWLHGGTRVQVTLMQTQLTHLLERQHQEQTVRGRGRRLRAPGQLSSHPHPVARGCVHTRASRMQVGLGDPSLPWAGGGG